MKLKLLLLLLRKKISKVWQGGLGILDIFLTSISSARRQRGGIHGNRQSGRRGRGKGGRRRRRRSERRGVGRDGREFGGERGSKVRMFERFFLMKDGKGENGRRRGGEAMMRRRRRQALLLVPSGQPGARRQRGGGNGGRGGRGGRNESGVEELARSFSQRRVHGAGGADADAAGFHRRDAGGGENGRRGFERRRIA